MRQLSLRRPCLDLEELEEVASAIAMQVGKEEDLVCALHVVAIDSRPIDPASRQSIRSGPSELSAQLRAHYPGMRSVVVSSFRLFARQTLSEVSLTVKPPGRLAGCSVLELRSNLEEAVSATVVDLVETALSPYAIPSDTALRTDWPARLVLQGAKLAGLLGLVFATLGLVDLLYGAERLWALPIGFGFVLARKLVLSRLRRHHVEAHGLLVRLPW